MESREIAWQNVMWSRVGTFMKVDCSTAALSGCMCVCMSMHTGRKATLSLAVSALIPERVKWTWSGEVLVPSSPMEDFRVCEHRKQR